MSRKTPEFRASEHGIREDFFRATFTTSAVENVRDIREKERQVELE